MRVSFSESVTTHTIPAMDPSVKEDLFYSKVDVQRMQMREQIRKEKALAKKIIRMMDIERSNSSTGCKAESGLRCLPLTEQAALQLV